MALGQGSLAGIARVAFEAQTGDFNADISRAEHVYRQATQGMSSDAIRLELAQEKLRRALAKGPGAYREIANAELNLRRVQEGLASETNSLTRAQERNERSLGRLSRGAVAGSGIFHGLGRSIAFASGSFLGGAGFVFALRSVLSASREQELVLGQTEVALESAGLSWDRYAKRIQTIIRAQSALGFDDEALMRTFATFARSTGDVDEALRLNALAADLARGRYIDLESAAKIVLKASLGMGGQLRRLGIDIDKNATRTQILAKLTELYGRSAEKASTTGIAAQDRLSVAIENTKEAIGAGLLPTVVEYTDKITSWLDTADHQEELQRKVNKAVKTGEEVLRGVAAALRIVQRVGEPVVDMLGGLEKAVELALIVGIVAKARKAAASFGFIAAASALTRTKVIADAAAMGTALDVATRPRVVPITVVGTGAGGAGRLGGAAVLGSNLAITTGIAILLSAGGGTQRGDRSGQYPLTFDAVLRASQGGATPDEIAILKEELGRYSLANAPDANMARAERRLRALRKGQAPDREDRAARARAGAAAAEKRDDDRSGRPRRRTLADIELDLARAETTATKADDLRYHRELLARYRAQAEALERRQNLTAKQKELLRTLYGQIASEQSAIDSIIEEGERRADEQRKRAAEKRKRERERRRREELKELLEYERRTRAAALRAARGIDPLSGFGGGLGAAAVEARRRDTGRGAASEKGLTAADVHRMQFEFLTRLTGDIGVFGSNFASDSGQVATQAYVQTQLMRDQNAALFRLVEGSWHPGAQLASAELSAAGWGVGF